MTTSHLRANNSIKHECILSIAWELEIFEIAKKIKIKIKF